MPYNIDDWFFPNKIRIININKRSEREFTRDFRTSATYLYQLNFCICVNADEPIDEYSFLEIKNATNSSDQHDHWHY